MSVSPISSNLVASASAAAQSAAASAASASASSASSTATANALSSLTSNFNTFLTLLTTQLQNQDPTSPMSSDTFTSELAQFAGVEQQVQTNTNLTQLISLGQSSTVAASQSMVGDTVQVSGSQIALQNSSATLNFTTTAAEPVAIAISDSSGQVVRTAQVDAAMGSSSWSWDGTSDAGTQLSDGLYNAAIVTAGADGSSTTTPIAFTSTGKVTGVSAGSAGTAEAELGQATLPLTSVETISATSTTSSG